MRDALRFGAEYALFFLLGMLTQRCIGRAARLKDERARGRSGEDA